MFGQQFPQPGFRGFAGSRPSEIIPPPASCASPSVCRAVIFSGRPAPAFDEEFEDIFEDGLEEEKDGEEAEVRGVVLDKNPLSLAYCVEGRMALSTDGVPHKVSIAVFGFSTALKCVCVPRKTSVAFIEGRIENTND